MAVIALLFVYATLSVSSVTAATMSFPSLPEPVANNAVASVTIDNTQYVFSFMGLGKNKTYKDVHNRAWQLAIDTNSFNEHNIKTQWQKIPSVPSSLALKGRLASVAVGVDDSIYIFGGYTDDKNHNEISTPDVYKYSPIEAKYTLLAPMPVPVDDASALVYRSRYVYLVSGWHNDGNVNLVQVYDTHTNTWQQASPFLGNPVFGQAGGIIKNVIVICDGVSVTPHSDKRRSFAPETACYKGTIDEQNPFKIDWRTLEHPTGIARYRMAAAGDKATNNIYFVGGSANPYNYNGIGYNGEPSSADSAIWVYDVAAETWDVFKSEAEAPTMDHRGLIGINGTWITVGGMLGAQRVSNKVTSHFSTLADALCSPNRPRSADSQGQSPNQLADAPAKTALNIKCQSKNNRKGEK
ncbi:Kelch repeat-containing protein [Alteromonas gracilis]|uniref:Kelch repeat-containing protein n=1 Tax=Alteromonas gracilis TaxID=1479524 RepID=UPI00373673B3